MDESDLFRTFCHISDYDEAGYANLHRLVATSCPLVLWSPSSALLQSPRCRVSEDLFLRYLAEGRIRVIGRQNWLLDKGFRNSHRWSGSTWNNGVDDAIRAIALNDESMPPAQRRVRICPDEEGVRLASEYVEQHPEIVDVLQGVLKGPAAESDLPVAVVQNAQRFDDPLALAKHVLRDTYNHLDAIALSQARAPFLLAPRESRFHGLMSTLRPTPAVPVEPTSGAALAELTAQVLELIRHMDGIRGTGATLEAFTAGSGHEALVKWLSVMCSEIDRWPGNSIDGIVLRRLQEDFDRGTLRDDWRALIGGWEGSAGGVGLSASVIDAFPHLSVWGAIGLAAGAVPLGRAVLKRIGRVPAAYEGGSQWPFLYAFGKPATGRRQERLGRLLDGLST